MNILKRMTVVVYTLLLTGSLTAQIEVRTNDKIAFLGDSITAQGNSFSAGYVNLVIIGLRENGINAEKIPAGIGGHKSIQMLERLERDVLNRKPQIMILSCGVNDVWHGKNGVPLPEYKKNITAIVEKAQAAGIKVCILTSTMIGEDPNNASNATLAAYNDFLRVLAKEKKCMLADLNAEMQQVLTSFKSTHPKAKGNLLTIDGVHMNPCGNMMMAEGVLRTFGFNDAQLSKARNVWFEQCGNIGQFQLPAGEFQQLAVKAADAGISIPDYIVYVLRQHVNNVEQDQKNDRK